MRCSSIRASLRVRTESGIPHPSGDVVASNLKFDLQNLGWHSILLLRFADYATIRYIANNPAVSDFIFIPFAGFRKLSQPNSHAFQQGGLEVQPALVRVDMFRSRMQFWVTRHHDRRSNIVSSGSRNSINTGQHCPERNKLVDTQSSGE
jgi:hypothetical protein